MVHSDDPIIISVPRAVLSAIAELPTELNDRMHQLLETNTEGNLRSFQKAELEGLVRIAQLGQIAAMALRANAK
jgi:hypothetical protein